MKSTITITPTTNIKNNRVVENNLIETKTYDSNNNVFVFYNIVTKETRRSNLMGVSLYDDVIIKDDVQYKILHMLSK